MSAPVIVDESSITSQCMVFCQTLTSQGKAFAFTLKIGETFYFSLDSKEKTSSPVPVPMVRKISPSTAKRNALRRQKCLASKNEPSTDKEAVETPSKESKNLKPSVSCEECGHTTKTVGGMKLHVQNKHIISQVHGNTSLVEIIEEETVENIIV